MPPVEALKGVSFELPSSGLVFILGKSGCGKTTLMNIIGGLDGFDEGDVTADGKSLKSFTEKDYDDYRNRRVGFVFQENNLFDEYTVAAGFVGTPEFVIPQDVYASLVRS